VYLAQAMDFAFAWLEATRFSTWLRESPSLWVFPFILILHTVGLAFLVGANVAINTRVLGLARGVPLLSLERYYTVMWVGFWINAASGVLLLTAYPTKALTNPLFYAKLLLVGAGLAAAEAIRRRMAAAGPAAAVMPRALRRLAIASLVCWAASIMAGRFLAYTYSRLLVDMTG
jgi:hypothetical protein